MFDQQSARERRIRRERNISYQLVHSPKSSNDQGLANKARNQELQLNLPCGWWGSQHLDHLLLLTQQAAGLEAECLDLNWCFDMGCHCLRQGHHNASLIELGFEKVMEISKNGGYSTGSHMVSYKACSKEERNQGSRVLKKI